MAAIFSFLNVVCFALGFYMGVKLTNRDCSLPQLDETPPKPTKGKSIEEQWAELLSYNGGINSAEPKE